MAELAARDGMQPPSNLPDGEFWGTRLCDGSIRIDRADPRILISGELLDVIARPGEDLAADMFALSMRLDTTGCAPPPWRATYVGAVLHINGINQQVIYRITEFVPRVYGYIGEWPD